MLSKTNLSNSKAPRVINVLGENTVAFMIWLWTLIFGIMDACVWSEAPKRMTDLVLF